MADGPRLLLAAPRSGSGKTLLTCALLRILQRKKIRAVSFKCGPDYIDPMFHREVLGIPSRNLDLFLAGQEGVLRSLKRWGAQNSPQGQPGISVIEGVMGYFDGTSASGMEASSYDLARVTRTPVILVVDVRGMARSVVPLLRGFAEYGDYRGIRAVLLNRVAPMRYPALKNLIERETGLRVLGGMPMLQEASWESRHLGLLQPEEIRNIRCRIDLAADALEKTLDLEELFRIAEEAENALCDKTHVDSSVFGTDHNGRKADVSGMNHGDCKEIGLRPDLVRVGVARDAAFSFYYEDNLDLLQAMGADLIPFSPMTEESLPDVDGLLLGGGYPELHLRALSENVSMRRSVRAAAKAGMPILAECGGFQYLQQAILDSEGKRFPMAEVLSGESHMTGKLVRFGYVECRGNDSPDLQADGSGQEEKYTVNTPGFLSFGHTIRGHEFHYSDSTENGRAWHALKPSGSREWDCMVCTETITAGYPHLYYPSDPAFAENFVRACREFRERRKE